MFDLEKAIAAWRHHFARRRGFLREDLDELERHLRDDVADALGRGVPEAEAFRRAAIAIGDYDGAEKEYRKVYWGKLQRRNKMGDELKVAVSMLKNYLKITLRSLARQKGYSFINIAGLTVGLASCLLIFQFVAFEYSFDRFHENEPDLYRVLQSTPLVGEDFGTGGAYTGFALGPALAADVPEVVRAARLHPENGAIVSTAVRPDRVFEENRALYADPAFLKMFSFSLAAGDPGSALQPGTVLLSETAARKYFGEANPIGQVLDVTGEIVKSYRVTGMLKDVPANSHLQFDLLLPMEDLLQGEDYSSEPEGGWSWNNFSTYVQLHPDADKEAADRKMTGA